ncbi:MAG TPA: hypothetical protein VEN81_13880 [Planctomycetota bacterium]|nr:hypothetical protein [Planctomycetota bacterium]
MRRALSLWILLSGCAGPGPSAPGAVDLLALVDPARDAVEGRWSRDGGALVTANAAFARIQIPQVPPEEYDVRLVAERTEGSNSIVLGLVREGRPFMVAIDAMIGKEEIPRSGVELIDGRSFPENETLVVGRQLTNGKRTTIGVSVRRTGVAVTVEGRKIIDWKAGDSRLGLHVKWKMPRRDGLWLGAFACVYRVYELTLVPATGAP